LTHSPHTHSLILTLQQVYTVQAVLAICVADASEDAASAATRHERYAEAKKQQAVQAALERSQEDSEGWDVNPQPPGGGGRGPPASMLYTSGGAILDV
jgi:Flp pilus assembly protein TadG